MRRVDLSINERNLAYVDSLLPIRQAFQKDLLSKLSCRKMKNIRKRVIMFSKKTGMPGVSTVHVCAFR